MKITSLLIENFRGIRRVYVPALGDTVIIAGQNGSGKSCVFDAIRLLKSVYGGYQQNEWQSWLGEFSIPPNASPDTLKSMFNDPQRDLRIDCTFEFSDDEKAFITRNAESLLVDAVWRAILPEAFQFGGYRLAMFASQFREREEEVKQRVAAELPVLMAELAQPHCLGSVLVPTGGTLQIRPSQLLSVAFSTYRPREIGVVDYHGAQRHYSRELVQAVNISLDQDNQTQRQHALYNYASKYANVKSELAASYVKEVFKRSAGAQVDRDGLTKTLQDLFHTFFPDKTFEGPRPTVDGNLSFPVKTATGAEHDLDDLSAGEKEILYGYLRIRNSAPKYSIILLDEPELHLNPRLIRNLPSFYRKHLGKALNNQIWLVSHSDALLREVVGKPDYTVFHMQPSSLVSTGGTIEPFTSSNQLKPLNLSSDVDLLVKDLVGDLASYQPGRKAIIFEGGGDSDFDQWFVSQLFSDETKSINLISGSNKNKVKALYEVLARAYDKGHFATRFFAVVDKDLEDVEPDGAVQTFAWDVYHIENYLLHPEILTHVVNSLGGRSKLSEDEVVDQLRTAARSTIPSAVRHLLNAHVSKNIIGLIDLRGNRAAEDFTGEILAAADRSLQRLSVVREGPLSDDRVRAFEAEARQSIETAFASGEWRTRLPGRSILKAFSGTLPNGISMETLRSLIVNRMIDVNYQPEGMKRVIDAIVKS